SRTQKSIRFVGFNRESAKKTDSAKSVFLCLLLLTTRLEYSLLMFPILHRNFRGHPITWSIIAATGHACKPFLCIYLTAKWRRNLGYSDNSTFVQEYNYTFLRNAFREWLESRRQFQPQLCGTEC